MEKGEDTNKNKQLNSLELIEYIIRKPMDKATKTWPHDPAVDKLHELRERIEYEQ